MINYKQKLEINTLKSIISSIANANIDCLVDIRELTDMKTVDHISDNILSVIFDTVQLQVFRKISLHYYYYDKS